MDQEHFCTSWQTSAYANYAVISRLGPPPLQDLLVGTTTRLQNDMAGSQPRIQFWGLGGSSLTIYAVISDKAISSITANNSVRESRRH